MDDWQQKAAEIAGQTSDLPQVQAGDVPDLALYMDQLVTFLDQRLGGTKREASDPFITSTMVNNYTKAKLVLPAEKKRYQRHHVLGLSMVGQLKKVLSMQDLSRITEAARATGQEDALYQLFLDAQREAFAQCHSLVADCTQGCSHHQLDGDAALAAMAVQLAAQAQCRVLLAERLLDAIEPPKSEEGRKKTKT